VRGEVGLAGPPACLMCTVNLLYMTTCAPAVQDVANTATTTVAARACGVLRLTIITWKLACRAPVANNHQAPVPGTSTTLGNPAVVSVVTPLPGMIATTSGALPMTGVCRCGISCLVAWRCEIGPCMSIGGSSSVKHPTVMDTAQ
jgi:hypothetical protein